MSQLKVKKKGRWGERERERERESNHEHIKAEVFLITFLHDRTFIQVAAPSLMVLQDPLLLVVLPLFLYLTPRGLMALLGLCTCMWHVYRYFYMHVHVQVAIAMG